MVNIQAAHGQWRSAGLTKASDVSAAASVIWAFCDGL